MFINARGNWECEVCGAEALLWGYHYPNCPVIRLTPVAPDAASLDDSDDESPTRAAGEHNG